MKKLFWEITGLLLLGAMAYAGIAYAQTIYTVQDTGASGPFGVKANVVALSVTNPVLTGAMKVDTKRTICMDVGLVDASAGITSVDMSCTYGRTAATVTAYQLPVFVSTTATGITSSVASTIRQTATGGGAPGTSGWGWCVTNIPGPFIQCSFLANGVITAAVDTLSVFARGVTP